MKDIYGNREKFSDWLPYVTKGLKETWYGKCPIGDWIEKAFQRK